MAATAYIFIVVISSYQIVAGHDLLRVLRTIAEESPQLQPVQEKNVPPNPNLQQPVVIIVGDSLLNRVHHHRQHTPRAVASRPKEDSLEQPDVVSQLIALLQNKKQVKPEPVTRRPRFNDYNLAKKHDLRSSILNTLLRISGRCGDYDDCEQVTTTTRPTRRPTTTTTTWAPPEDDYCDPCEDNDTECGQRDNCPKSTQGYTLEPGPPKHCNRC